MSELVLRSALLFLSILLLGQTVEAFVPSTIPHVVLSCGGVAPETTSCFASGYVPSSVVGVRGDLFVGHIQVWAGKFFPPPASFVIAECVVVGYTGPCVPKMNTLTPGNFGVMGDVELSGRVVEGSGPWQVQLWAVP